MENYQIIWRGHIGGPTGYDRAGREYVLGLDRLGVDIKIEPMSHTGEAITTQLRPEQDKRLRELIEKPYSDTKPKLLLFHSQPFGIAPEAERRRGYDKIVIMTVWETTKIPENWLSSLNAADAVIVPSAQNVEAMIASGVDAPIFTIPHGADVDFFKPGNPELPLMNVKDTFNFLSVFQWQHRKSPDLLLKAYWEEFGPEENVSLIIKTGFGQAATREQSIEISNRVFAYKKALGFEKTSPVYLSTSNLDDEDLKGLYALADTFVLPSRGEGVGLPYLEALSSGIPVISTNWGGQVDFLHKGNAILVDYRLCSTNFSAREAIAPLFSSLFTPEMEWAEPDLNSLKKALRFAYENKAQMKEMGLVGRMEMERLTWDSVAIDLKKVLNSQCKR